MFARVSRFRGTPGQAEAELAEGPPAEVIAMSGFKGAYSLFDRENGKCMLVTLWESEDDMRASAEQANRIRAAIATGAGSTESPQVESYEVLNHP